ncbi:MAG: hypothetical protein ACLQU5_35450 [Isosphaeraceae bacterium]
MMPVLSSSADRKAILKALVEAKTGTGRCGNRASAKSVMTNSSLLNIINKFNRLEPLRVIVAPKRLCVSLHFVAFTVLASNSVAHDAVLAGQGVEIDPP